MISSPFTQGKKLDDWLSPILIKELRQGMRARAFVISFLLLQVFLFVLVIGNVAAQNDRQTLDTQNHFFWVIVGFALLVLMPMRGLVAVSLEVKNRTMETIMLTRLTAWRVVFGKWSALFAQSLLFVSAVLPYVVLRYFIGGNDVVSDFVWILLMLWLSGILIAGGIAVSGMGNPVVRIIVLIATVIFLSTGIDNVGSSTLSTMPALEIIAWLAIFGFFIPALLFELTASTVAPASENHALRRRVLALLFFACACGLDAIANSFEEMAVVVPLVVLIGICYFELAEKPRLLPRMVDAFSRKGIAGKTAAIFFLPGWPSGLLFSLVVIPVVIAIIRNMPDSPVPSATTPGWFFFVTATLGSVLAPILICHLLWPKNNQVLLMVVLYNIVLLGVSSLLEGLALVVNTTGSHLPIQQILAFLPSLPSLTVSENADPDVMIHYGEWYLMGHGIVITFLLLLLWVGSRSYYRELFALLRSGTKSKSPETAPVPEQAKP